MTKMVNRAKGFLGRKATPLSPTPFSTRCQCGETIQGYRRVDFQVLTCPQCSSSIFILPRNPLPTPEGIHPKAVAVAPGKQVAPEKGKQAPRPVVTRPPRAPREPIGPKLAALGRKFVPPRRWFTIPRLIFVGVVLLVGLTAFWQIRSRQLRNLREELIPQARRGLQALTDGNLAAAHEHLQFTVHAMDTLGESVPDSANYRQAFAELDVVHRLLEQSMENSLYGGVQSAEYISSTINNKTVLLDVVAQKDEDGNWNLQYFPMIDGEIANLDISAQTLWDDHGLASNSRTVFGVALAGIENDSKRGWLVRTVPGTAVLITEPRIVQELGLALDPTVMELIEKQRVLVQQRLAGKGE